MCTQQRFGGEISIKLGQKKIINCSEYIHFSRFQDDVYAPHLTCAPETTAWKPEPHNLLTVRAGTPMGIPHLSPICRDE